MADTLKRLAGPDDIPNSSTDVYTVPSATTAAIRNIHIANTTASAATIRLSIGTIGVGTALLYDFSVPANGTYDWSGLIVMAATEVLKAQGGTNNALCLTVSGVEVT